MRAAVVPSLGAPLEIRDLPVPDPGPGQVLVRIEASGLCHTDIHAAGRTRVIAENRRLEQVNEAFDEVLAGDVPATTRLPVLSPIRE